MPQSDQTMKRLTSVFTRDYVRFVLGSEPVDAEPVTIEEQDKELPALSREVLEQSQQLILEEIPDREQRADAYVALRVLSGITYPSALVSQILKRREIMLESPVYREILEEGEQKGRQAGRQEGLCADVLAVLEVRFGPLPDSLAQQVGQVSDRERLEALHRHAVVVESLEVFVQELG